MAALYQPKKQALRSCRSRLRLGESFCPYPQYALHELFRDNRLTLTLNFDYLVQRRTSDRALMS